ncbi:uncharacterized protein PpBr36_09569 [Pyricularia pennisetigena]|uniref:uncharacterized protein n=1 Tax=Pyricularia pennisetigena TaxID=1578925 RepID=UPI001151DBCE|nr:uncharacterized protein PpBr36_09569 [Pyricularia pennisetigena]TLS21881.1 hypothetical protein PpBr36_09569 [Pyricularia pennisetigena]
MIAELLLRPGTWTALAVFAAAYYHLFLRRRALPFPLANKSASELQDPRALITDSLAKNNGGPVLVTLASGGSKVLLPASLAAWVKSNRDLDHHQLVREDFMAGIPGFEANTVLHAPGSPLIDIIKTRLGFSDATLRTINASLERALPNTLGERTEWHAIDWCADTSDMIARAASSIFVGPEKADDPEWLELAQRYVAAYFAAVGELAAYPAWSRRIMHWFLPNAKTCRGLLARARVIMKAVVEAREQEAADAKREGRAAPEHNDALEWVRVASGGRLDPADGQLSLAMAAFFTTAELLRVVLIEVARHPEYVEELRKEVSTQLFDHGVSVAAVNGMVLLDSFMKESQRLNSGLVVLERVALKNTALPDGRVIPRGSHVMVDSTDLWNSDMYPNANEFDGRRFLKRRKAGDNASQLVQSSPDYHVFGGGRHICPGRFFAAQELKLVLAHVLVKYHVRLAEGCAPKLVPNGFLVMADPNVRFEVRRRKDGGGDLLF